MPALEDLLDGKGSETALLALVAEDTRSKRSDGAKEVVKQLKKRISSSDVAQQKRALRVTQALVTALEFPFHEQIGDSDFLNSLVRVCSRDGVDEDIKKTILRLAADWAAKFQTVSDLLPGFQDFHVALVSDGHELPHAFDAPPQEQPQVMDEYLTNEAEGQDPEEFIAEVKATLILFDDIAGMTTRDKSQTEALISIAN